jgi:methylenetetrahydrofolate dehydrogenase (NADP+)/methenyltetrahydrofolate cyclohydrolase
VVLPDSVTREQFITTIQTLNNDLSVHGVLVLQPLPRQLDSADIRQNLLSIKDVDGVTEGSLAAVYSGGGTGFAPCTAAACLALLKSYRIALAGKRAVVLGRSLVVGRPLSMLLMRENATVTVCHSGSQNLPEICQEADLIVAAAGQAGLIGAECLRAGQTVLDVGIHTRAGGGLCGDVRFEEAEPIVRAITPVPGGVGAVTTAILASHVIEAAERVKRS